MFLNKKNIWSDIFCNQNLPICMEILGNYDTKLMGFDRTYAYQLFLTVCFVEVKSTSVKQLNFSNKSNVTPLISDNCNPQWLS